MKKKKKRYKGEQREGWVPPTPPEEQRTKEKENKQETERGQSQGQESKTKNTPKRKPLKNENKPQGTLKHKHHTQEPPKQKWLTTLS